MILLMRYFWLVFILTTCLNALSLWWRARRHIAADPSLKAGYRKLFWGVLIIGNIPWLVMGFGCVVGGVPSIMHFFRPRDGNPFVIAFFASVFAMWILGTYWLFARGGAEMLLRHPGMLNVDLKSPTLVKLLWCLCLMSGIAGVIGMFVMDVPIPPLK